MINYELFPVKIRNKAGKEGSTQIVREVTASAVGQGTLIGKDEIKLWLLMT